MRRAEIERNTKETQIKVAVNLDGTGNTEIATPMPFFGGRAAFVYRADSLKGRRVGSFDAELAREFFSGFASAALCNLHMEASYGENAHHILEALFKAFARALRVALAIDPREVSVPSTKGTLTA